ncbi:response regulator transcription factor [Mucilaginibacter koreensis]
MPKRIFIADDDPGIVDAVQMILDFYGYEVSYTYDGADLLNYTTSDFTDLILLDIWMSGTDGRDVCRALKAHPVLQSIPVIMISASKDVTESALASGADAFIAKPFDMDQLIGQIEKLLDSQLITNRIAI